MYARYLRSGIGTDATRYQFQERVSLFGCNSGFIPWLLSLKIPQGQAEPFRWHVNVLNDLECSSEYPNNTLIIDLKPKQNEANLSLYEVMDVWGYSGAYVLSWCKCSRFRRLEGWRGFWVKFMRFNELFD